MRGEAVLLIVPETEHAIVLKILLPDSKGDLGLDLWKMALNDLQHLCMDKQLHWVEHRVPMREPMIGNASIVVMSHEAIRNLARWPKASQIRMSAIYPFLICCVKSVRTRHIEESSAIGMFLNLALRAVALNGIHCHWTSLP